MTLILDGKVNGKVDQVNGRLELDTRCVTGPPPLASLTLCWHSSALDTRRYTALASWTAQLAKLQDAMVAKTAPAGTNNPSDRPGGMMMGPPGMGMMMPGQDFF